MGQKAPGRYEREGVSLLEILDRVPDEVAAQRWFEDRVWPGRTRRSTPTRRPSTGVCGRSTTR